MVDQQKLATFKQADAAYQNALAEADALRPVRDRALLALRDDGCSLRELVAETGLSLGRVQQIVNRATSARGGA